MKLSELIKGCDMGMEKAQSLVLKSWSKLEISAISSRAQDVIPGGLFLAVRGYTADGHDYIDQAIANGAVAVIAQTHPDPANPDKYKNIILVEDSRKATAIVAANFYGCPSRDITLVGVTGTNGKTTITWLLENIFNGCGFCTGVIGTVNIRYKGKTINNPVTTPDAIGLQKTLFQMKQAGVTHAIMEVSSHGLDQHRVDGCEFDAGIYTNLTQDHLDYHKTMAEYFQCKRRFFTDFLGPNSQTKIAPAVINIDNDWGKHLAESLPGPKFLVSHTKTADVCALNISDDINGLSGTICLEKNPFPLKTSLTGTFNLENILCAAGAALALGIDIKKIQQGIEKLTHVPGRLEKITNQLNRYLFVDYAHTPDALESILSTLAQRAPARVITVFGCGGDRDRTKRPPMGKIACKYSDVAIVTSDNPRNESPETIVKDIIEGIQADGIYELDRETLSTHPEKKGYFKEIDRKNALELAIMISNPSDIIVAAGKGHETYQITNTGTIHFDDKEELIRACKKFEQRFAPMGWVKKDLTCALSADPKIGSPGIGTPGIGTPEVGSPLIDTLDESFEFSRINTDSRTITPGEIFLALKGDSFDGHDFIPNLLKQGVQGFVAKKGYLASLPQGQIDQIKKKKILFFETENTINALGRLARYQRLRSNVKLVAITGSNGKTTTRKITHEIFNTHFPTLATRGNFNNEIGMPLSLLNLSSAHEWAIIEMGMNHPGEISRLAQIACPDIAIVTNTAGAHLEGLETSDNVAKAKGEIFEHLRENGVAIIFADDKRRNILTTCAEKNKKISKILYFGSDSTSDTRAQKVEIIGEMNHFTLDDPQGSSRYSIGSPAPFMVNNTLAAITAARVAGISNLGIQTGLAGFTPVAGRMKLGHFSNGIRFIDDTYNANPASMGQALKTLNLLARGKTTMAILGDMLELGTQSAQLHRDMGKIAATTQISQLYLFGKQVEHIRQGALENGFPKECIFWGAKDEIADKVLQKARRGDWILFKGSRSMGMETILRDMDTRISKAKEISMKNTTRNQTSRKGA